MKDVKGKVALVTGGGRGLGKGIALSMAKSGMDLIINDVIEENANAVAEEIRGMNQRAIVCTADISSSENVRKTVREGMDRFGRIDVLVNNAGISPRKKGRRFPFMRSMMTSGTWSLPLISKGLSTASARCRRR